MRMVTGKSPVWSLSLCMRRTFWCVCMSGLIAPILGACGQTDSIQARSITVDREISFRDIKLSPRAIVQTREGGFVVAGVGGTAQAVATNKHGEVRWKYNDGPGGPDNTHGESSVASEFQGVVALANGNLLFCGSKLIGNRTASLITILDDNGHVVEQRIGSPKNGDSIYQFFHCLHWNDGIALIGLAFNGTQGSSWLMKLDSNGETLGDAFPLDMPVPFATEMSDHSLSLVTYRIASFELLLASVDPKGEVIARRSIKSDGFLQLRSVGPPNTIGLISYGRGKSALYTLNERLEDTEGAKQIRNFIAEEGCGYVLPDKSLALFGRRNGAAVAWISESGQSVVAHDFSAQYPSFVINDAIPVSENQFVTVRYSVSANPDDQGLVMSWVTIK